MSSRSTVTPTIRHALPEDVPDLADLAARTFPLACPPELGQDAITAFIREHLDEAAFHDYLAAPEHTVLIARTQDARAVAYALLVDGAIMDPACAELLEGRRPLGISKFYLDPALHGTGGAVALLDEIIRTASEDRRDSLWLATNIANGRARSFYVRSGFVERGHRRFEVGGTINNDVVYERLL